MGYTTDEIMYEMSVMDAELGGPDEVNSFFSYLVETGSTAEFMSHPNEVYGEYNSREEEIENIEDAEESMREFEESLEKSRDSYQMGCDFKGVKQIREYEDDDIFIPSSYLCVLKCYNKYLSDQFGSAYELKLTKPIEEVNKFAMTLNEARKLFDENANINPITGVKIVREDLPAFYKRGKNGHPVRVGTAQKSSATAGILCMPMKEGKLKHAVLVYFCEKGSRKQTGKRRDIKRINCDKVASKIEIYQEKDLTSEQKNISNAHKKMHNRFTVSWDIETMTITAGKKKILTPIAVGFKFIDLHNPIVNDEVELIFGLDCISKFVSRINEIHASKIAENKKAVKKQIMLYAHNGGRFDTLYIKTISDDSVKFIEQINGGGSQIKRLTLEKTGNGVVSKLVFTDSLPFSLSSLEELGKTLKIRRPKIELDIADKDYEWYKNNQDIWRPYLARDVLALEECLISLDTKYHQFDECINEHFGVASIAWTLMYKSSYKIEKMTIPSHPVTRKFIRDSIYGGRIIHWKKYFNKGPHKSEDKLISLDANSLYPTAMAKGAYPAGKYYILEDLEVEAVTAKITKGYLLIAEVTLDAGNVRYPLIPYKDGDGNLLYPSNEFTGVYNSVDIMEALNLGYKLKKVHRGIWWTVSRNYFSKLIPALYEYRQKLKKEGNDLEYVIKILLNSMYGKYLENIKTSISFSNSCLDDWTKECIKKRKLPNGQKEYSLRDYYPTERKPAYVGSFILSYARVIVNREIMTIGPENIWYGDTDSLYTTLEAAKRVTNMNNDLGGFKNDYGENKYIDRAIFLDIKRYFLHIADQKDKEDVKVKFNGISFKEKKGKSMLLSNYKYFKGTRAECIEDEIFLKACIGEPIPPLTSERWERALGSVMICEKDMQFQMSPEKRAGWIRDEYYPLQYDHNTEERIMVRGQLDPFAKALTNRLNYDMTLYGINSKLPLVVEKGADHTLSEKAMKALNINLPFMIGKDGKIYQKRNDEIIKYGKYGIDNTSEATTNTEVLKHLFWLELKGNDPIPNETITRAQADAYLHNCLKRFHSRKAEKKDEPLLL